MDERIDLTERPFIRDVQGGHDPGDRAGPEPDAHEMARHEVETVWDPIREGARRTADAREYRDLCRSRHVRGRSAGASCFPC